MFRHLISVFVLAAASIAAAQVNITTYHNDNLRTGLNSSETVLTPTNVNSQTFGLLFSLPVDGAVYAQPLYLSHVTIAGKGVHNVVYVATQHNSIFAFDADSNLGTNSTPLWHGNFGPSVPSGDTGSGDIYPEIGITGTPVISPPDDSGQNGTLYVVSKTKTLDQNNNPVYANRLHALDVSSGAERTGSPVTIQATVKGVGDGTDGNGNVPFNPLIQQSRPGLLLVPGSKTSSSTLYIGFASHGDNGPYHGWVFAYNAFTLKQTAVLNTTPNGKTDPSGYPIAAGGIWQGGGGLASDGTSIFFSTGNGKFDPATGSYGDSVLKVNPLTLSLQDYFSPSDELSLDYSDADLGSGGVLLLPPDASSAKTPYLMVQSGKEGTVYLMDRENLGKFNSKTDKVLQELPQIMGGIWGSPAYFNGNIYFGPIYSPLVSIPVSHGVIGPGISSVSPEGYAYPGPTPAVSSNGTSSGIVWTIQTDNWGGNGPAYLHAYDATNLNNELYASIENPDRDTMGNAVKFTVPTVANGKVYAGTMNEIDVFGIGTQVSAPSISPSSGRYTGPITYSMTDSTPGARIYYTTDGTTPSESSTLYKSPFIISNNVTIMARAYKAGAWTSSIVEADYLINPIIGKGNGLTGAYFNGTQTPVGNPTVLQVAPEINFEWNGQSPAIGVLGTNWSATWTGYVMPETTGTYSFYTNSSDGVMVYVNGQPLINDWSVHLLTSDQAPIQLVAGLKYTISISYFERTDPSMLQLYWSAPGLPKQIIPKSQLFSSLVSANPAP